MAFLDEIESESGEILYYCEIHWFSKGKVLQLSLSLLEKIKVLFIGK
jgi:hypothetical protein